MTIVTGFWHEMALDSNRLSPYNISVGSIFPSMTSCMPQRGEASQMARDEARHGKAFAGLLKRYFGK